MEVERVVRIGKALANPHRVMILHLLLDRPHNVSELSRALGLSRPVVNMHLSKLVDAGFVRGAMEISGGNAMKNYEITSLKIRLDEDDLREVD